MFLNRPWRQFEVFPVKNQSLVQHYPGISYWSECASYSNATLRFANVRADYFTFPPFAFVSLLSKWEYHSTNSWSSFKPKPAGRPIMNVCKANIAIIDPANYNISSLQTDLYLITKTPSQLFSFFTIYLSLDSTSRPLNPIPFCSHEIPIFFPAFLWFDNHLFLEPRSCQISSIVAKRNLHGRFTALPCFAK